MKFNGISVLPTWGIGNLLGPVLPSTSFGLLHTDAGTNSLNSIFVQLTETSLHAACHSVVAYIRGVDVVRSVLKCSSHDGERQLSRSNDAVT